MSYATCDDMILRFGELALAQLTDRAKQAVPEPGVMGAALSDASELIDGYAAARYKTPLSPVPAPVKVWTLNVAYYLLHGDAVTEDVRKLYEDALSGLRDMTKGVIVFQAEGIPTENSQSGAGVRIDAPRRVFTGPNMKGF